MGRTDVASKTRVVQLFTKIDRNASATIQGTDVSRFDGQAFIIDAGAYTSGTGFDVTLQHRDGTGSWVDIPHNELDSPKTLTNSKFSVVEADADKQFYITYTGNKKELGAVLTREGSGVMVVGVSVLMGDRTQFPA
jgi:hypothetical protein